MLPITTRKKDRRNPFAIEQLGRIFGPASPLYRPGTPLEDRGGRFWVPLLSLWSGMRLNECCQPMIDDVRYVRDIPIIVIAEDPQGSDEADAKRVKTEAGERFVPVHPELERLGFLRHLSHLYFELGAPKGATGVAFRGAHPSRLAVSRVMPRTPS